MGGESNIPGSSHAAPSASRAGPSSETLDLTEELEADSPPLPQPYRPPAVSEHGALASSNQHRARPTPPGSLRVPLSLPRTSRGETSRHFKVQGSANQSMHKRPAPGVPITPMDPTSKFGLGSSIDSPYGPPAPNNSFYDNAAPSSSRNQSGSRRAVGPQLGFSSSSAAGRRFQPPGTSSSMNGLSRVPTVSAGYTFDDPRNVLANRFQQDSANSRTTLNVRGAATRKATPRAATHAVNKGKEKQRETETNATLILSDEDEILDPDGSQSQQRRASPPPQPQSKRPRLDIGSGARGSSPDPMGMEVSRPPPPRPNGKSEQLQNTLSFARADTDPGIQHALKEKPVKNAVERLQPRGYKAIAKEQGQTSEDMSARSFNKFSKAKGFKEPAIVDFGFVSYSVMSQQGLHASVDFALTDHRLLANLSPPHLHTFTLSRLHGGNQMHEILSFRREHLHMVNTSSELFKFTFKAIKALDCVKCESHAPSDSDEVVIELREPSPALTDQLDTIFKDWATEPRKIPIHKLSDDQCAEIQALHRSALEEGVQQHKKGRKPLAGRIVSSPEATKTTVKRVPARAQRNSGKQKIYANGLQQTNLSFPKPAPQDDLAVRRSSRPSTSQYSHAAIARPPEPEYDPTPLDKVVLTYPMNGAPGAVSITHGDTKRLADDEFLNDTLIEYGMKRIFFGLKEADEADSQARQLSSQVHMFHSFFYKRISQRKQTYDADGNKMDPYTAVRKWTQKIDLFSKKFVVVPINEHLHWYLAIVVNPGAVLRHVVDPDNDSSGPRRTRQSVAEAGASRAGSPAAALNGEQTDPGHATGHPESPSAEMLAEEAQAEKVITDQIALAAAQTRTGPTEDVEIPNIDADGDVMMQDAAATVSRAPAPLVDYDDSDEEDQLDSDDGQGDRPLPAAANDAGEALVEPTPAQPPPRATPILPASSAPGDTPPDPTTQASSPPLEFLESPKGFDPELCYVLVFDSLGGKHDSVLRHLRRYLINEALDKKGIRVDPSWAENGVVYRSVEVPLQRNYSDCGLYVLHFVTEFLRRSEELEPIILRSRPRGKKVSKDLIEEFDKTIARAWDAEGAQNKRKALREDVANLRKEFAALREPIEAAEALARKEKAERREAQRAAREAKDAKRAAHLAQERADEISDREPSPSIPSSSVQSVQVESKAQESVVPLVAEVNTGNATPAPKDEAVKGKGKAQAAGKPRGRPRGAKKQTEVVVLIDSDDDDGEETDDEMFQTDNLARASSTSTSMRQSTSTDSEPRQEAVSEQPIPPEASPHRAAAAVLPNVHDTGHIPNASAQRHAVRQQAQNATVKTAKAKTTVEVDSSSNSCDEPPSKGVATRSTTPKSEPPARHKVVSKSTAPPSLGQSEDLTFAARRVIQGGESSPKHTRWNDQGQLTANAERHLVATSSKSPVTARTAVPSKLPPRTDNGSAAVLGHGVPSRPASPPKPGAASATDPSQPFAIPSQSSPKATIRRNAGTSNGNKASSPMRTVPGEVPILEID